MRRTRCLVLASLLLTACGGSSATPATPSAPGPEASPPPAESVVPTTPATVEQPDLGEYLDETGVLQFDAALSIFAANYGPVPGVTPAAQAVPDSSSAVLDVLISSRDRMTAEQQAVLDDLLGPPGEPLDGTVEGGASGAGGFAARPAGSTLEEGRAVVRDAMSFITGRIGRSLDGIVITTALQPFLDGDTGRQNFANLAEGAVATRKLSADPNGALYYDECNIRFNADAPLDSEAFRGAVAHEVYHCFQYDLRDPAAIPLWAKEGSAAYVGEVFVDGDRFYAGGWWGRWLRPTLPLTSRSYDAIGLFSLAAAMGHDPFRFLDTLLLDPRFDNLVALTDPSIQDRLATHYANRSAWGPEFTIAGPGFGGGSPEPSTLRFTGMVATPSTAFAPGVVAAQVYRFAAPGEVLVVESSGHGGVYFEATGASAFFGGGYLGAFCLLPGGCVCPGETSAREGLQQGAPDGFLGMGPGGSPTLTAQTLDEFCAATVPTTTMAAGTADGCVVGEWAVDDGAMAATIIDALTRPTADAPAVTVTRVEIDGTWHLSLGADGSMTSTVEGWVVDSTVIGPPGLLGPEEVPIGIEVTLKGVQTAKYTASGGAYLLTETTGATQTTGYLTIFGTSTPFPASMTAGFPTEAASSNTYTCSGSTLVITPGVAGGMSMTFQRV